VPLGHAADAEGMVGAAPRSLSGEEVAELLKRLETRLQSTSSLRADFIQEKHMSIFTDVLTARGTLLFERPNAVRFEMIEPFRSVLVARGRAVAKYECVEGRWEKLDPAAASAMKAVTDQMILWHGGSLQEQKGAYDIGAVRAEHTTIVLTPRDREVREYIGAVELTLDEEESYFQCVTIRESGGDYTCMRFARPARNLSIPKAVFDPALDEPVRLEDVMPSPPTAPDPQPPPAPRADQGAAPDS